MASPPFQVEDQTDEDFFDKLVDDDYGVSHSQSDPSIGDGVGDESKAFSNQSITEGGTESEDSGGEEAEKQSKDVTATHSSDAPDKDILISDESGPLVLSNLNSVNLDTQSSDVAPASEALTESSTSSTSTESKSTCIKEVQWSAFNVDSAQQSSNGFGSYSDFFSELGDNAADLFANVGNSLEAESNHNYGISENGIANTELSSSVSYSQPQSEASTEQAVGGQDSYNTQYWENLYPGWKYDHNTGQWVQVDGYNATENVQGRIEDKAQTIDNEVVSSQKSEVSYLQQTPRYIVGTVTEGCTTASVSTWNQVQQEATEYPAHMIFDPQYPGWYYDTIAQEWRLLESYTSGTYSTTVQSQGHQALGTQSISTFQSQGLQTSGIQSTSTIQSQGLQSGNDSGGVFYPEKEHSFYSDGQVGNYGSQGVVGQGQGGNWSGVASNHVQQNVNMWHPQGNIAKQDAVAGYTDNQHFSRDPANNLPDGQLGITPMRNSSLYEQSNQSDGGNTTSGFRSFVPSNFPQPLNQSRMDQSQQTLSSNNQSRMDHSQQTLSSNNFNSGNQPGDHSHQLFQNSTDLSYNQKEERSSAGRPPHALVTFGFGGKIIVMKDSSSFMSNLTYGSQGSVGGSVSVIDMMDVLAERNDSSVIGLGVSDYFCALCQQSFPGPLVGGSVGSKELNKWIDDRIANCESPNMDYRKRELLTLLFSLLKIASQHYGKLRSPFGTEQSLKENDRPEAAVARLFASAKRNGEYGALAHCLQNVPSERQCQATAVEVQNLLVSGRTKEALHCAQEGQLWGPALILAAQLSDQFYVDTVKQMAHRQLVAGSPLRTLCLLIAGQPADVFSGDSNTSSGLYGTVNVSQHHAQIGSNGMLDDWEENLAVMTANRTKGDELVILHLGDCLWKERGEITAAHICYLVAEANFESFSDSARLCLVGADHWKFPRTYASPEAIQRTELYEYSMVLGNSQSILLPFQPYKLIYAYMLAEVGKVSDSLKYCQALLKSLKTGQAPEVDAWKQLVSSLEERIRTHQQGGFSSNLAPAKLVGKLLPFIDRSIKGMIGPPPPPASSVNGHEHDKQSAALRVASSQSTMAMSSLMPSASMEPISAWAGSGRSMPNRSISEPDFGRTPRQDQVNPSKGRSSSDGQSKVSDSGGPSRFGRIGSTLLQKTMGWVSRSRPDRQAKLGEKNKFYYDEKLKRWVEEGAEPPSEETAPPPPPITAAFQNGMSEYNIKMAFKGDTSPKKVAESKSPPHPERSAGIPPMPPSSNQFSARGRMGVRSRYVDTFNKDGGAATSFFHSPPVSAVKPLGGANAKFFIPAPTPSSEQKQTVDAAGENLQEATATNEDSTNFMSNNSFSSPQPSFSSPPPTFSSPPPSFMSPQNSFMSTTIESSPSIQRIPSMNNITPARGQRIGVNDGNGPVASRERRAASWSGNFPKVNELRPLGEQLALPQSSFMPADPSSTHLSMNGGNSTEDLQEVKL